MKPYLAITVLLLVLLAQPCSGQTSFPSKKQIQKLFISSIKQESKKKVQVGSNAWSTCNIDSTFFRGDTIVLDNSSSRKCCESVEWTFYRKDSFVQSTVQTCREPSTGTPSGADDFYRLNLNEDDTSVLMQISNRAGKRTSYRVVNADSKSRTITIVRTQQTNL